MGQTRDYSRFLKEDGRLNIRFFPRPIYLELLKRYRSNDAVVDDVFRRHFWLWDLDERMRQARQSGRVVSRADLADELISEMDDKDWWQIMGAFEEHLQGHFLEVASDYAELVDPVYDLNDAEGWRDRHYDPVTPAS